MPAKPCSVCGGAARLHTASGFAHAYTAVEPAPAKRPPMGAAAARVVARDAVRALVRQLLRTHTPRGVREALGGVEAELLWDENAPQREQRRAARAGAK